MRKRHFCDNLFFIIGCKDKNPVEAAFFLLVIQNGIGAGTELDNSSAESIKVKRNVAGFLMCYIVAQPLTPGIFIWISIFVTVNTKKRCPDVETHRCGP